MCFWNFSILLLLPNATPFFIVLGKKQRRLESCLYNLSTCIDYLHFNIDMILLLVLNWSYGLRFFVY